MSIITATLSSLYDVSYRDMQTKIEMSVLQTTVICSQSNVMYRLHAVRYQITKSNSLIVSSPAKAGNLKYVRYWRLYSNAIGLACHERLIHEGFESVHVFG